MSVVDPCVMLSRRLGVDVRAEVFTSTVRLGAAGTAAGCSNGWAATGA